MSSLVQAIVICLTGEEPTVSNHADKKEALLDNDEPRTAEAIAEDVVQAIVSADKGGKRLQQTLNKLVGECGWTEKLAECILVKLERVLREAQKLSPTLKEAYDKSWEAATVIEGFVKEHPVFCTVIAIGVLVLIAPWAVEVLSFGELGPIEGSFAAIWQARYAGLVPKGSLFSFLQRLGMTWQ